MPSGQLFPKEHGTLPAGPFREALLGVERVLKKWGIRTLIPHRDVNKWGEKSLAPIQAAELCTAHVVGSDGIVALLGTSHGAHYEVGVARGIHKPIIAVKCNELGSSFIGSGVEMISDFEHLPLVCERIDDIPKILDCETVRNFLARHMSLFPSVSG